MTPFPTAPLPTWPTSTLTQQIADWTDSTALTTLVHTFGGHIPDGDLHTRLTYLHHFSTIWDYRAGNERFAARYQTYDQPTTDLVRATTTALGLTGATNTTHTDYDHLLILGGNRITGRTRALHAATQPPPRTSIVGLGSLRPLPPDPDHPGDHTEGDVMHDALTEAFPPDGPTTEHTGTTTTGHPWWIRTHTSNGRTVHTLAAPPTRPGQRANTADTLIGWTDLIHRPTPGEQLLLVTTDLYRPFQHTDAITTLGLPLHCGIDTIAFDTTTDPHWPNGPARPGELLQETRSAILSLHRLHRLHTAT